MSRHRPANAYSTSNGRFSAPVLRRRVCSLGYRLTGQWRKPADRWLFPVERTRDGVTGRLELWYADGKWGHVFVEANP